MEFAHLVHAVRGHAERYPWAVMLLGGALLFLVKDAWPVHPELSVIAHVRAGANSDEVRAMTDEAILLGLAERAGFIGADRVVRERLIQNVRFAWGDTPEAVALARAKSLGMHRTDAVAKSRLVWLARQALAARTQTTASDSTLQNYLEDHSERFAQPPAITLEHVFVARRDDFAAYTAKVTEQLAVSGHSGDVGDVSLLPRYLRAATPSRIRARLGREVAELATDAPVGAWTGPVLTLLGAHWVRVNRRVAGRLPNLALVRDKVRHQFDNDSEEKRVNDALARLRAAYNVELRVVK